jgi:autotransporter translocation and assembly factor TamB
MQAQGKLQGHFERFTAHTGLSVQDLSGGGLLPSELRIEATAAHLPKAPQGELSFSLSRKKATVQGETRFAILPTRIAVEKARLSAPGLLGRGDVAWQPQRNALSAEWSMHADSLDWLQPFVRTRTSGRLSAEMSLEGTLLKPSGTASLEMSGLQTPWLEAETAKAEASFRDLTELSGTLSFTGSAIQAAGLRLEHASITAEGGQSLAELSLKAQGGYAGQDLGLDASAQVRHAPEDTRLLLPSGQLLLGEMQALWSEPISLHTKGSECSLDAPAVSIGGGRAKASLRWNEESLDGRISLSDLNLQSLPATALPKLEGLADLKLILAGSPGNPRLELQARMDRLRAVRPDMSEIPAFALSLKGDYAQGTVKAALNLQSQDMTSMQAELKLPLALSLSPFRLDLDRDELQGSMEARLDLGRAFEAFPLDAHRIDGQLQASLHLSGRLERPSVKGELSLQQGSYENLLTGTLISDIRLRSDFLGRRLAIRSLEATDGRKGRISGEGEITFDQLQDPAFDLNLRLDKAELVHLDYYSGQTSGSIRIRSRGKRLHLSGDLSLFPIELRIPQPKPKGMEGLTVVDVTEDAPDKEASRGSGAQPPSFADRLDLDLKVRIPGGCFVRGRGLDSEWKGDLAIHGTGASPLVSGSMDLIRGRLDFLGKRLQLEQGRITFLNTYPPEPVLDLTAVTKAKDIEVILRVEGPVRDLKLTFASEPPYPRDEILARFLFNRELSAITPLQAVKLALAIRTLTGSGQPGFMDKLRQSLQIDVLELESGQGEDAGPVVGVGKYLNENIFFKVEKGLEADTGRVSVEVDITPQVSVETQAGSVTQSFEVKWKYSY